MWLWQEELFCVLAYAFTTISLVIDAFDLCDVFVMSENGAINELMIISFLQFLSIVIIGAIWIVVDKHFRGNQGIQIWFTVVNRFMPGATVAVYLLYYILKLFYPAVTLALLVGVLLVYSCYGLLEAKRAHKVYIQTNETIAIITNHINNT